MPMPSATRSAPGVDHAVRSRRLPLAARPGVIAEARAFTAESLADTKDRTLVEDVVLLVSELVANAVRHAGGPRALLLVRGRGLLRVEVTDRSPRPPRIHHNRRPTDIGGLGLFLLAELSRRWGWYHHGPGKVVWFEVDLPRTGPPPGDERRAARARTPCEDQVPELSTNPTTSRYSTSGGTP